MATVAPVLAAALLVASLLSVLAVRPVVRTAPATLLRAAD
jgi:hypothetical protein